MKKIFKFLFPFYKSSKYDFLIKKWWHRLFIVLFIIILIVLAWEVFIDLAKSDRGGCDAFLYTNRINFDAYRNCLENNPVHYLPDLGIILLVVIAASYIIQLLYYKVLIFIIFGKKK